jgi:hypothetical protein
MKYTVIIAVFFISNLVLAQNTSEMHAMLSGHLKKMTYYKFDSPNSDSVEIENAHFKKLLLRYLTEHPSSLTSKMDKVVKAGLIIAASEDSLFRIYSWDTQTGGTMRFYDNIYQYSSGGKVFVKESQSDTEGDPKSWYSEIYTMNDNENKYYLGVYNAEFSTRDIAQGIKFYAIENNLLNTDVKLAKTKEGLSGSLGINFDFFTLQNHDERPLKLVLFDSDKKTISVPIVTDNDKITDKFNIYKLKNGLFEEVK